MAGYCANGASDGGAGGCGCGDHGLVGPTGRLASALGALAAGVVAVGLAWALLPTGRED